MTTGHVPAREDQLPSGPRTAGWQGADVPGPAVRPPGEPCTSWPDRVPADELP